ncbi:FAS-associated factor 2 [Dermatophagoides farinae]|uniref:FAS-associated factor 2 n=1 Tax=Dermatophagoides farinae TaxID=6954 RepID=A0A922L3V6_DERFA|nr:FAS-associated factor 2-like [Dermatophagoides farinae]KAH7637024.1 fas-associated factor 2-b-like protein [Dermatophagoides farinae]KAH9510775.1 FAS-associated factor 2 [Dermatophagoides farinae]
MGDHQQQDLIEQIRDQLTEDQRKKLSQFKDISGMNDFESYHILRANEWNVEIALDLTLEGAYNRDVIQNMIQQSNSNNNEEQPDTTTSSLRRRNVPTPPSSFSSTSFSSSSTLLLDNDTNTSAINNNRSNNNSNNDNDNGLHMVLWNTATWIFKLPFILVMNTLNTFYDFFISMIYPTLNYDPNGTVELFIREFEEKYGQQHPTFFRGTYSQVIEHGKREIRFVLIYIHSPSYRDIDKFCTNVIITQKFIDLINGENLIFWSCSVDYPEGYKAYQSLKVNQYPFMALIGLKNHKMIVMKKIEGFHNVDTIVATLRTAIQNNEFSLMAARLDRQERDMASLIRAQQDAAFEESLKADQEKERRKREEREQIERKEFLERQRQQAEEERKQRISDMKKSLLADISTEPDADQSDAWRIMFKLPNGTRLERRFLRTDPVKYLYYYVFCKEMELINFKLRTNFPTRDLPGHSPSFDDNRLPNSSDMNLPLEQCNLDNNIVLFVHDLDS